MKVDLLVAGGGIAGMAAAARAVELGLDVVVAEKGDDVGGSGALSAGIVWTAPDLETARRVAPEGDPALLRALVEGFDAAIECMRGGGVAVSDRWSGQMGFGVAHHVDIAALLGRWRALLGGAVLTRTAVSELIVDADGAVRGARLKRAAPLAADELHVTARAVLLATGGFQGDGELVARLIGSGAERMPVRSNPGSVGDGLRLGRSAGASLSRALNRFYGHLIPDRLDRFGPDDYLPLTQYHSAHAILVNVHGRRFTDESRGDELSNQAVLREPESRAVLICDERVRRDHAVGPPYPHGQEIDRFAAAAEAGGRLAKADTIGELAARVGEWGVDAAQLERTLASVGARRPRDAAGALGAATLAPAPLREPPFHALAVAPCITFTFGGLRTDPDGRVLDRDGRWVPNLYAAGADAGGLQGPGYVGGLALGLVFGPRVAEAVAASGAGTLGR
jgi:succinate dehydrogenase/fumarate reductase flavoprotein subunit